jgi:hypothetical protein
MTKLTLGISIMATFCLLLSCTKVEEKLGGGAIDSVVVNRDVALSPGAGSPHGRVSISLQYIKGGKLERAVNNAILQVGVIPAPYFSQEASQHGLKAVADTFAQRALGEYVRDNHPLYLEDKAHAGNYEYNLTLRAKFKDGPKDMVNYVSQLSMKSGNEPPSTVTKVKIISSKDGQLLQFDDLFQPGSRLSIAHLIEKQLERRYGANDLKGLQANGFFTDDEPYVPMNFMMDAHSVTFIYCEDEIAPHQEGEIHVKFSRRELKRMLK